MLKKTFFILLSIASSICLNAQAPDSSSSSVHYNFTHVVDSTLPDQPLKSDFVLFLGKNSSLFTSYDEILSEIRMKEFFLRNPQIKGGMNTTVYYGAPISFLKDNTQNLLSSVSFFQGNKYVMEEKMPAIKWQITNETKTIQGYPCQKATTTFRGRDYEAWFCSQLPFSNGPWKLGGLPGLILEASDAKKEVVFTLKSFQESDTVHIPIQLPANTTKATAKELNRVIEASQNGSTQTPGTMVMGQLLANGAPAKRKQYNNPIEKVK